MSEDAPVKGPRGMPLWNATRKGVFLASRLAGRSPLDAEHDVASDLLRQFVDGRATHWAELSADKNNIVVRFKSVLRKVGDSKQQVIPARRFEPAKKSRELAWDCIRNHARRINKYFYDKEVEENSLAHRSRQAAAAKKELESEFTIPRGVLHVVDGYLVLELPLPDASAGRLVLQVLKNAGIPFTQTK